MAQAYHRTYGMPTLVTRSSNNYGPRQYPEKLIPLTIKKALAGEPIPVYGDGRNVRDWLYVEDNCRAIDLVLRKGTPGDVYNIGGGNEMSNIDLVHLLLHLLAEQTGKPEEDYTRLITFVSDRPGHDRRYAVDSTRLTHIAGNGEKVSLPKGLRTAIHWSGRRVQGGDCRDGSGQGHG
jgi:dTDP-glucose 4,6-dehydratase